VALVDAPDRGHDAPVQTQPSSPDRARTPDHERRLPPGPKPRKTAIDKVKFFASFFRDPLGFVGNRFDTYGDVYFVPDDAEGLFVFRHPDHVRELLSAQASKFKKQHSAFDQLGLVLGEGLLTTDGDVWKRQRRLVQPGFSKTKLARYGGAMVDETLQMMRDLEGEKDMSRELMELTLRAVSRTLFGHDARTDVTVVGRSMQSLQTSLATSEVLPIWLPIPGRGSVKSAIRDLDEVVYGLIHRRQAELARGAEARDDLLDALLAAVDTEGKGDKLTDREIRDQLMTLFLAGHETTSHALTWTLYLLSQNPGARERLIEETRSVLAGRPPTIEDLPKLPFAEQVVKEALRLYPPAYILARKASDDAEIGGYKLVKGTEAVVWVYFTQRDPRWFEDPHAFVPERFSPERESSIHPFAFVPFGAGPRACIGKAFAMLEAHLMLVTLCQRFRFELVSGHPVVPQPRITMHPKHGMRMRVERIL
jgi:cytochrome P450